MLDFVGLVLYFQEQNEKHEITNCAIAIKIQIHVLASDTDLEVVRCAGLLSEFR